MGRGVETVCEMAGQLSGRCRPSQKPAVARRIDRQNPASLNVNGKKLVLGVFHQLVQFSLHLMPSRDAGPPQSGAIWKLFEHVVVTPHRVYLICDDVGFYIILPERI